MTDASTTSRPLFNRQQLISLFLPLVAEQALSISIGLADTLMVSSVGEAAVSGVSLVDSFNVLMIQLLSALATGGAAAPIPEKEVCSMRNWFSRHPVSFMAFYLLFYLSAFHWLEVHIAVPDVLVHCHLDDLIPFCKYAIVPYFAWFLWIPFTLFYLLWKAPRADFWRLCLPLFAGMTIALACYVILPTGLNLRPYRVYGSDIFAQAVRMLYATDTPLNVCPSIHVFNSVTLMMAYYRSRIFETPGRRWMRPASAVLCVSIIASTVLLKQHSCIDVLLGILLAMALDTAMTVLEHSDARALQRL